MANKKQKRDFPVFTVFCAVVGLLLAIIITISVLNNMGTKARSTEVLKVGEESVNALEFSYAYQNVYSQYAQYLQAAQVNTQDPNWINGKCMFAPEKTWKEFFLDGAVDSLKRTLAIYQTAVKDKDFKYDKDAVKKDIDTRIDNDKKAAEGYKVDLKTLYSATYGKGFNEKDMRGILEKELVAAEYSMKYAESLKYDEAALEKFYTENKADYDVYTFVQVTFTAEKKEEKPEVQNPSKPEDDKLSPEAQAAKAQADALLEKYKKEKLDEAGLLKAGGDKAVKYDKVAKRDVVGTKVQDWLTAKERKVGDIEVVNNDEESFAVILFLGSERDNYKLANLRVIPLEIEKKDPQKPATKDEIAAFEKKNAEILAEFEKTGKTEEDFKKLATKYIVTSPDADKDAKEGFVKDLDKGNAKLTYGNEVREWIYSADRKAGDYNLIKKSDESAYLVFFVSQGDTYWTRACEASLKNKDFAAWEQKIIDSFKETTTFNADKALMVMEG